MWSSKGIKYYAAEEPPQMLPSKTLPSSRFNALFSKPSNSIELPILLSTNTVFIPAMSNFWITPHVASLPLQPILILPLPLCYLFQALLAQNR